MTELLKLKLKHVKDTKGTYVYQMVTAGGVEVGNVYLPKLLLPAKPGVELEMVVSDGAA